MKIDGRHHRTIWINVKNTLNIINQLSFPHIFEITNLSNIDEVIQAIGNMTVRGVV